MRIIGLALALAAVGCSGQPTAPTALRPYVFIPEPGGPPGFRVRGLVADPAGRPIGGVRVEVLFVTGSRLSFSNDAGRYEVSDVPAGAVAVTAAAGPGGGRSAQPCMLFLTVTADAEADVEMITESQPQPSSRRPFTLSGVVVEIRADGTRAPLPGISVVGETVFGGAHRVGAGAWSDEAGRYQLCGLRSGDTVSLSAQTRARGVVTIAGDTRFDIEIRP